MITQFDAAITLLGAIVGLLGALVTVIWKARGYIDRLNSTDSELAQAIRGLASIQAENTRRLGVIERRLANSRR